MAEKMNEEKELENEKENKTDLLKREEEKDKESPSPEEQPQNSASTTEQIQTQKTTDTVTTGAVSSDTDTVEPTKTFFIAIGVLFLILILIFFVPRLFSDKGAQTLQELHEENLAENRDSDTKYVYNGYSFIYYDGLWYTQILNQVTDELYDIPLHFGPRNLTDIIITGDLDPYFNMLVSNNISNYSAQTYLTFDPYDEQMGYVALATGELTQNLARTFGIAFIPACTQEGVGCENVPIISCNSTEQPIIYMKSGQPTVVYTNNNCITIQGDGIELVRATDRFVLKLYNVMI